MGQGGDTTVVTVMKETAYTLFVLTGIERALTRKEVIIVQLYKPGRPPAGLAVRLHGQGNVFTARMEHGPDRREIASGGLFAVVNVQYKRSAVADNFNRRSDDVADLRGMEQPVSLGDGQAGISVLAQGFFI